VESDAIIPRRWLIIALAIGIIIGLLMQDYVWVYTGV
jgi:hypothetical protein